MVRSFLMTQQKPMWLIELSIVTGVRFHPEPGDTDSMNGGLRDSACLTPCATSRSGKHHVLRLPTGFDVQHLALPAPNQNGIFNFDSIVGRAQITTHVVVVIK
jgi:hypothetical protein